jgi:hypothetical protein
MTDESTKYLDFIFVRMEAEIREKIAKEIEANCGFIQFCEFGDCTCGTAAAIARGKND